MPKKINFWWVKDLASQQEKIEFEKQVEADVHVLRRLSAILNEMETEIDKEEASIAQFDNPNWQFKQAFRNGDRHRLAKLRELISHLQ